MIHAQASSIRAELRLVAELLHGRFGTWLHRYADQWRQIVAAFVVHAKGEPPLSQLARDLNALRAAIFTSDTLDESFQRMNGRLS